ncbi:MAG: Nif3-like dinuclear metal center hexameric protein [Cyclobacteriaceae bacterium]
MKIKDITSFLESIAPSAYQESYDNSGLITGNPDLEVSKVLITLDCIEDVVDEAIAEGCNLIIAHHPIVFKGLKKLNGKNYVERTVIKAIKNDIAIYAIHTNLDNVHVGVNKKICDRLGLIRTKILAPKSDVISKLVAFCPKENTQSVLEAIHKTGAGSIGNYSHCSFVVNGQGSFKPTDQANPHIGKADELEHVDEDRIEVQLPTHMENQVLSALFKSHPYEQVAYYIHRVNNHNQTVGSGMIGELENAMKPEDFLEYVKTKMDLKVIRHTAAISRKIRKIAVCGGSGSFLLSHAKRAKADAFITADFKYHEFFDAEKNLMILDIGHFESEVFTKELLSGFLTENFANIAPVLSRVDTNPVKYFN